MQDEKDKYEAMLRKQEKEWKEVADLIRNEFEDKWTQGINELNQFCEQEIQRQFDKLRERFSALSILINECDPRKEKCHETPSKDQ